jgi:predicted dehydrogenase
MKIGIIGSDNSHAAAFAKAINVDKLVGFEDVQVSHIWGQKVDETQDKVTKGSIPFIVAKPEEILKQADAVLVVLRHGGLHLEYTKPFLEAGMPVFIDKPFACSTSDARKILELAAKKRVPITSFSLVRYDSAIQNLKQNLPEMGKIMTGDVAGVITPNVNEYGGMIFYGIHTTELMLEIFGYGVEKIFAIHRNDNTIAIASYPHAIVTMHFMGQSSYLFCITVHGTEKSLYQPADANDYLPQGLKQMIHLFRTHEVHLSPAQLFEPVAIHEAIDKSLQKGKEVDVEKY